MCSCVAFRENRTAIERRSGRFPNGVSRAGIIREWTEHQHEAGVDRRPATITVFLVDSNRYETAFGHVLKSIHELSLHSVSRSA